MFAGCARASGKPCLCFLYIILKEFLRIDKVGIALAFAVSCDIMAHYKGVYEERMNRMRNEIYTREWRWMEQLSAAFHVFSANIGPVLQVMAVVFLPISLLEVIISDRMLTAYALFQQLAQTMQTSAGDMGQFLTVAYQVLLNSGLLFMVSLFLQPVGVIAIAKIVKQYIDGEEVSLGKALSEAFSLMPAILLAGVIYGVLLSIGSIVIVPAIYFGIAWGFYLYCMGLSGKKGWAALQYSKSLVKGKWWRTLAYFWLLSAIGILWNSVFELVYVFAPEGIVADLLYHFLCYFSAAFAAVGETLLFLNREAVTYGPNIHMDGPREENREEAAEPVEGTVEGDPLEHPERKDRP